MEPKNVYATCCPIPIYFGYQTSSYLAFYFFL